MACTLDHNPKLLEVVLDSLSSQLSTLPKLSCTLDHNSKLRAIVRDSGERRVSASGQRVPVPSSKVVGWRESGRVGR